MIHNWPWSPTTKLVIVVLAIWVLIWKGFALWKAARRNEAAWFVVFMIINTFGILEILYLYIFSKKKIRVVAESREA